MALRGRAMALQRPKMRRLLRRPLWSTLHGRRRWTAMTPSTRRALAWARIWELGSLLLFVLSSLRGLQPQPRERASAVEHMADCSDRVFCVSVDGAFVWGAVSC